MSNTDYPCSTCKQNHCICYEKGTKTRERAYVLETYKCTECPKVFDCIGDLDKHIAKEHSREIVATLGHVNGLDKVS